MIIPELWNGYFETKYLEEIRPTDNFIKEHKDDAYFMAGLNNFKLELKLAYMFSDFNNPGIDVVNNGENPMEGTSFNTSDMSLLNACYYLHGGIHKYLQMYKMPGCVSDSDVTYQGCCQILSDDTIYEIMHMGQKGNFPTIMKLITLGSIRVQLALGITNEDLGPSIDPYKLYSMKYQYTLAKNMDDLINKNKGIVKKKQRTKKYRECVYEMYQVLGKVYIDFNLMDGKTITSKDDELISQNFAGVQRFWYKNNRKEESK